MAKRWRSGSLLCALSWALSAHAAAATKTMFVTSATGTGNLGSWPEAMGQAGPAAGNRICRTLAAAAGLEHAETYRAWLSTPVTDAFCRVAGFNGERSANCGQAQLPEAGPWVRTDGAPFASSLAALTDSDSYAALHTANFDENGAFLSVGHAFTGTNGDGRENGNDCDAWTSNANSDIGMTGQTRSASGEWTRTGALTCEDEYHLLCFEPGAGDPLPDHELPGAYAFVTSASGGGNLGAWSAAGAGSGLTAGDAICRELAADAGLPEPSSFVAWLSTESVFALDRLPGSTPFKRVDGIQIAADKSALVVDGGSVSLDAPLNVTQFGTYLAGSVHTGTPAFGGTSDAHCDEWTSDQPISLFGYAQTTTTAWSSNAVGGCGVDSHLYCFSSVVTIFRDGFERGLSRWSNF